MLVKYRIWTDFFKVQEREKLEKHYCSILYHFFVFDIFSVKHCEALLHMVHHLYLYTVTLIIKLLLYHISEITIQKLFA